VTAVLYEWSYFQIADAEDCLRKWAWERLEGVERERNKHAAFGIDGHDILKNWLAKREFDWKRPASKAAAELAKYLPMPQEIEPKHVELEFGFEILGEKFIGGADLFVEVGRLGRPVIYDHKFTTDPYKWALAPESFKDDIQATIYATYAIIKTRAPAVDVQWTYSASSGKPRARPVTATLTATDITPRMERTLTTAKVLRTLYEENPRALDLPPNVAMCEAYGGCPFRKCCNLTPSQMMEAIMAQGQTMAKTPEEYLAELRARRNGQAIQQPVNPPGGAPAPIDVSQPVQTQPVSDLAARMAERRKAMQAAAPAPAAAAAVQEISPSPPPPAEEKPARAPGRPKKDTSTPVADVFMEFLKVTWPVTHAEVLPRSEDDEQLVAELAASRADKLVMQQLKRFAG